MDNKKIDQFNKLLTNTLRYKEMCDDIAEQISHKETASKLEEFANISEKESKGLIKLISAQGGDVQTTPRHTDQDAICWTPHKEPDLKGMSSVIGCLIDVEQKKIADYKNMLTIDKIDDEAKNLFQRHLTQADSNLNYLQVAQGSCND